MTNTVLVSGPVDGAGAVVRALEQAGATAVAAAPGELASVVTGRSFDGYVQLPIAVPAVGDTMLDRVRHFLAEGLLGRFTAAAEVAPALSDGAVVVLAAGHTPGEDVPDDRAARLALMRVLGHAIRADIAPRRVRVRLAHRDWTSEQLARLALGEESEADADQLGDMGSALSYEDWRTQVLGVVGGVEF